MNRKDKHINKFLHDQLPEPEIPADDAWAGMNGMLDVTPLDSPTTGQGAKWPTQVWKSIGKLKGLMIGISTMVAISAGVALVTFYDKTGNVETATSHISAESKNAGDTVTALDSVTERTENSIDRANSNRTTTADSASESKETRIARDLIERATTTASPVTETVKTGITRSNAIGSTRPAGTESQRTKTGNNPAKSIDNDIHTAQTQTYSHIRTRNAQAPVVRRRDVHEGRPAREDFAGNALPESISRSGNTGNVRQRTKSTGLTQTNITISVSHENTVAPTSSNVVLNSLQPLPGHFGSTTANLSKYIQKPVLNAVQPAPKTRKSIFTDLHFGPEWNINRSIASTEYMFAGADSVKRPWRLAIPGIFVSKSWNRHSATLIFNPLHTYFGDKERVAQRIDSVRVTDSLVNVTYYNTNFIKALGINFSLQYQYQVAPWLSLVGGMSYARYSAALFKKEMEFRGNTFPQAHLTVRNGESLKSYINPQQWSIRAGLLSGTPAVLNGRLQIGLTFIIPVSNLSLNGFKSVRSPNVQGSLRFLIK